jgi:hypothetical protein
LIRGAVGQGDLINFKTHLLLILTTLDLP